MWSGVIIAFLMVYVTSFVFLRRCGVAEAKFMQIPDLYLFLPSAVFMNDEGWVPAELTHRFLYFFYFPLWKIDESMTGQRPFRSLPLFRMGA